MTPFPVVDRLIGLGCAVLPDNAKANAISDSFVLMEWSAWAFELFVLWLSRRRQSSRGAGHRADADADLVQLG
jgi:hypothetical protein